MEKAQNVSTDGNEAKPYQLSLVYKKREENLPCRHEPKEAQDNILTCQFGTESFAKCRQRLRRIFVHPFVGSFIMLMVILYTVTVLAEFLLDQYNCGLVMQKKDPLEYSAVLRGVDLGILSVIIVEVFLKSVAFGKAYLMDWLNIFDIVIILLSFGLGVTEAMNNDPSLMQFLRVLRLLRLIIIIRKVTARTREFTNRMRGSIEISSPVERIIDFLSELEGNTRLSRHTRGQLRWAVEVLGSRKLYEPLMAGDEKFADTAFGAWLQTASHSYQPKPTKGQTSDISAIKQQMSSFFPFSATTQKSKASLSTYEQRLSVESESLLMRLDEWDFPILDLDESTKVKEGKYNKLILHAWPSMEQKCRKEIRSSLCFTREKYINEVLQQNYLRTLQ